MTIQYHWKNNAIISGMTLKNEQYPENYNMGLHVSNQPEVVNNNRVDLATKLNIPLEQFVCAQQTHSDHFYKVTGDDSGRGSETMNDALLETDALYTFEKNIVLCSFTADCVPLTFYDKQKGVIGAVHSGWQGTVKEITVKLFRHLIEVEKINPKNIHVHLGACISQTQFEVDEDVMHRFKALDYADEWITFRNETNKYHINNQAIVKKQCLRMGIPLENIEVDETCTYESSTHFSHREDKKAGRHLSFIVRKN